MCANFLLPTFFFLGGSISLKLDLPCKYLAYNFHVSEKKPQRFLISKSQFLEVRYWTNISNLLHLIYSNCLVCECLCEFNETLTLGPVYPNLYFRYIILVSLIFTLKYWLMNKISGKYDEILVLGPICPNLDFK